MEAASVRTPRLELTWLSPEFIGAFLAGDRAEAQRIGGFSYDDQWAQDTEWVATVRLDQMAKDPAAAPWLLRAIVLELVFLLEPD